MNITDIKELISMLQPAGEATKQLVLLHIGKDYLSMILTAGVLLAIIRTIKNLIHGKYRNDIRRDVEKNLEKKFALEIEALGRKSIFNDVWVEYDLVNALSSILKNNSSLRKSTFTSKEYLEFNREVEKKLIEALETFKAQL